MPANQTRRKLCGSAAALALIPLATLTRHARAASNAAIRAELHYQDTPQDDKNCMSCLEFIIGKNTTAPGGCKLIPGDDDISPNGYCTGWNTM